MAPVNIHPPDPDSPKGMSFILGVGAFDPRTNDRMPIALTQGWQATSELWWDLGLRWHPDLATKWAVGGGQFQVAQIVKDKPDVLHQSLDAAAEEMLEDISKEFPEYAEKLKAIRESGSPEARAELIKQFESDIKRTFALIKYVSEKPKG